MARNLPRHGCAEQGYLWPSGNVEQVRVAGTVTASESLQARHKIHTGHYFHPTMLAPLGIVRIPGLNHGHVLPQVVDMPVSCLFVSMVPHHPCPDPACAERTTDVNVVTFPQLKLAQSPNRYPAFVQATKNDCVGTWL
jgi:hypothetical protein